MEDDCIFHPVVIMNQHRPFSPSLFGNRVATPIPVPRLKKTGSSGNMHRLPSSHRAAVCSPVERKRKRQPAGSEVRMADYTSALRHASPQPPACLYRVQPPQPQHGAGKMQVMVKIAPQDEGSSGDPQALFNTLRADPRRKQLVVCDPSASNKAGNGQKTVSSAPRMFAFDTVFPQDASAAEISSAALPEVLHAVMGGSDACVISYGESKLNRGSTMLGSTEGPTPQLGVIPTALSWLYRLVSERRGLGSSRCGVRVSAAEVVGRQEATRDLLAGVDQHGEVEQQQQAEEGGSSLLLSLKELRASTCLEAAQLLDAALAARTPPDEDGRTGHMIFTLHVYQHRVEKGSEGEDAWEGTLAGGRSRLFLIDLGSWSRGRDVTPASARTGLSTSAIGSVLLALANGQRHIPYRESCLSGVLREAMGSLSGRVCMMVHASPRPARYNDSLQLVQLAAKLQRASRRRRGGGKMGSSNSGSRTGGGWSSEEGGATETCTSGSELSCDTAIFVGHTELEDIEGSAAVVQALRRVEASSSSNDDERVRAEIRLPGDVRGKKTSKVDLRKRGSLRNARLGPPKLKQIVEGNEGRRSTPVTPTRTRTPDVFSPVMARAKTPDVREQWVDGPVVTAPPSTPHGYQNLPGGPPLPTSRPTTPLHSRPTTPLHLPGRQAKPPRPVRTSSPVPGHRVIGKHPQNLESNERWIDGPVEFQIGKTVGTNTESEVIYAKASVGCDCEECSRKDGHKREKRGSSSQRHCCDCRQQQGKSRRHSALRDSSRRRRRKTRDQDCYSGSLERPRGPPLKPRDKRSFISDWVQSQIAFSSTQKYSDVECDVDDDETFEPEGSLGGRVPPVSPVGTEDNVFRDLKADERQTAARGIRKSEPIYENLRDLAVKPTSSSTQQPVDDQVAQSQWAEDEANREKRPPSPPIMKPFVRDWVKKHSVSSEHSAKDQDEIEEDFPEATASEPPPSLPFPTPVLQRRSPKMTESFTLPRAKPVRSTGCLSGSQSEGGSEDPDFDSIAPMEALCQSGSYLHVPALTPSSQMLRAITLEAMHTNQVLENDSEYEHLMDEAMYNLGQVDNDDNFSTLSWTESIKSGKAKLQDLPLPNLFDRTDGNGADSNLNDALLDLDNFCDPETYMRCFSPNPFDFAERERQPDGSSNPDMAQDDTDSVMSVPVQLPSYKVDENKEGKLECEEVLPAAKACFSGRSPPKARTIAPAESEGVVACLDLATDEKPKKGSKAKGDKLKGFRRHFFRRSLKRNKSKSKEIGDSTQVHKKGQPNANNSAICDKTTNSPVHIPQSKPSHQPVQTLITEHRISPIKEKREVETKADKGKDGKPPKPVKPNKSNLKPEKKTKPGQRDPADGKIAPCSSPVALRRATRSTRQPLLSPYTKVTSPRSPYNTSSGHGSDNSSSISGGVTNLRAQRRKLLSSGGISSGYESMAPVESEGSAVDTPHSASELSLHQTGVAKDEGEEQRSRPQARRSKSIPRPGRHLSPIVSRSVSPHGLPPSSPWPDFRKTEETLKEDQEERCVQEISGRGPVVGGSCGRGEIRERVQDLMERQTRLRKDLSVSKARLMIEPESWSYDLYVAEQQCREDAHFLEALEKETSILEQRVNACKSHIMIVTCFDSRADPE